VRDNDKPAITLAAPRALRDASARFGWLGEAKGWSVLSDIRRVTRHLSVVRMVNAGDVDMRLDAEEDRDRIIYDQSCIRRCSSAMGRHTYRLCGCELDVLQQSVSLGLDVHSEPFGFSATIALL
jgi:hypothetical protein